MASRTGSLWPALDSLQGIDLVDRTRPETFTSNPDDHRELVIQIRYPAQVEPGARLATYMENMPFLYG
jgi:hypothetical protein